MICFSRRVLLSIVLSLSAFSFTGCITTAREKEMREDIFNVQTRLIDLEKRNDVTASETKSTGEVATKKIASTNADLEKMQMEIAKIKGEIDSLKVGVQTGVLPGTDKAPEGSPAAGISSLNIRIATIEDTQRQIIEELENVKKGLSPKVALTKSSSGKGSKNSNPNESDDKKTSITSLSSIRGAFDKKRYKQIIEQADPIVKKLNGKDREEGVFYQAESLYRIGQVRDAALKYNDLIEIKGGSGKYVSQAKMRLGDAFRHLGDNSTAKLYYEEVLTKFPNSSEASKAKERVAELNATASTKKGD